MLMKNGKDGNDLPTYTLKNTKTDEVKDVILSWEELQKMLQENPDLKQVLQAPKIIGGRMGNKDMKTPDGFKDLQQRIKKGSGRGNTINI